MKRCFIVVLIVVFHLQPFAQQALQKVQYRIDAKLEDRNHTIDGAIKIDYTNQSADTLRYLWLQVWPNAFKNDRTAYSEYMLDKGTNDFYFSSKEQKGYINRLVFRSGNEVLNQEDHPQYIDITKVVLNRPLPPGGRMVLMTPFHVQLPYDFSGFGYNRHHYRFTNWYPSVALYDSSGWRAEPYTGQQQKVHADFIVSLTLPARYAVTTNAVLLDSLATDSTKTLRYEQKWSTDFAWRAGTGALPEKHPPANRLSKQLTLAISRLLSHRYLPAIGYNVYDGLQVGLLTHDLRQSEKPITYYAAPMYALNSKRLTGLAGINYALDKVTFASKVDVGITASAFSNMSGADSAGAKVFGDFYRIVPYVRVTLRPPGKHIEQWIEWKTYIVGERDFDYLLSSADSLYHPVKGAVSSRYLNQLTFSRSADRSLYPYQVQLQLQQASTFFRVNAEARYFFNYAKGGGMKARLFAAKFGYVGNGTESSTFRYQPKLTAVRGDEDYTYSDAFAGRNEFDGFSSQQVMMRDGGLKLRTDLFQDLQGRSDNWIASINLSSTLPSNIFPPHFPLRVFLDAGTYAAAWKKGSSQPRFLYVTGLQLSLCHDLVNVYAPLLYSGIFKDNLKTVPEQDSFGKRISFSIDVHRFSAGRLLAENTTAL